MVTVPFQEQDEKKETPNRDGHTRAKAGQPDLVKELCYVHASIPPSRGGLPKIVTAPSVVGVVRTRAGYCMTVNGQGVNFTIGRYRTWLISPLI